MIEPTNCDFLCVLIQIRNPVEKFFLHGTGLLYGLKITRVGYAFSVSKSTVNIDWLWKCPCPSYICLENWTYSSLENRKRMFITNLHRRVS